VTDLGPLAGLASLRALALSGTRVTDLAPLHGLKRLSWLGLRGITMLPGAGERLQQMLPECQIAFDSAHRSLP
jgi:hypothetical protein